MKSSGPSKSAERAAAKAQEEANRAQREALAAQANMQANFAQNLESQNVAAVIPGGTADALDISGTGKKRRPLGTGLASTLGISV